MKKWAPKYSNNQFQKCILPFPTQRSMLRPNLHKSLDQTPSDCLLGATFGSQKKSLCLYLLHHSARLRATIGG